MRLSRLIIEGQQFAGKTTIANNLARRYLWGNPFLFKLSGPSSGNKDRSFKGYVENVLLDYSNLFRHLSANSIICDKFHISEQVYGKVYRGYEHDPEFIESVESILHTLGFKLIHLEMDDRLIEDRLALKEVEFQCKRQSLPSPPEQRRIKRLYERYVNRSRLDVIRVDVSGKSVLETVQEIMTQL
ncbi:MAG: hypothetical protein V1875_10155 [Candidatus Altiarchaeota archaeon]